jgi:acyl-CoA synthetase (AMP-forming)/AMP-acid ligase II
MTPLPMFHIGGIGWAFLGLWNGATTVLVSQFVAEDVLDVLEQQRVTNAVLVPTMIQMLTAVPGAAERDYSELRSIAYGASPITTTCSGRAAHVPLSALRRLWSHRVHGRRRSPRTGGSRSGRTAPAPAAVRRTAAALGGREDRRSDDRDGTRPGRGR